MTRIERTDGVLTLRAVSGHDLDRFAVLAALFDAGFSWTSLGLVAGQMAGWDTVPPYVAINGRRRAAGAGSPVEALAAASEHGGLATIVDVAAARQDRPNLTPDQAAPAAEVGPMNHPDRSGQALPATAGQVTAGVQATATCPCNGTGRVVTACWPDGRSRWTNKCREHPALAMRPRLDIVDAAAGQSTEPTAVTPEQVLDLLGRGFFAATETPACEQAHEIPAGRMADRHGVRLVCDRPAGHDGNHRQVTGPTSIVLWAGEKRAQQ